MRTPVTLGLGAFALYVLLGAPGATWYDGAELALAAQGLGVAHPPGEPAYLVLAGLAALLPVGDVSFRLTLLSAACLAGSVGLLTWLGGRLGEAVGLSGAWVGGVAGAALAVCPLAVLQGVRPELYAPMLLLGLLGAAGIAVGGRRGVGLAVLPLAVAGAVHHAMLVAALPGLAVAAWLRGRRAFSAGLAVAAALVIPALGQFAWLPLRSLTNPAMDFGTPRTLGRLIWSVTAAGYARSFQSLDAEGLVTNLAGHGELALRGFGAVGLGVAAVGAIALARRRRGRSILVVGGLLGGIGVAPTLLQGLFMTDNPDAAGYLLGPASVLASLVGLGVAAAVQAVGPAATSAVLPRVVGVGLALAAILGPARRTVEVDMSAAVGPSRLADAVLDSAPPGALVLLAGDGWAFPALLARYGEGRRVDVAVASLHMLDLPALDALRARGLGIPELSPAARAAATQVSEGGCCVPELLASAFVAGGASVYVNETFLPPALERARRPRGLLYALDRPTCDVVPAGSAAEDALWEATVAPLLAETAPDPVLEGLLGRRYLARAGFLRSRGHGADALVAVQRGSSLASAPWSMVHLHRYRAEEGLAPIAPQDGSGAAEGVCARLLADGPSAVERATADGTGTPLDLRALRGTIRLMGDEPVAAREDIAAVLNQHPDHPLALPAAERLMTLGHPVEVVIRPAP